MSKSGPGKGVTNNPNGRPIGRHAMKKKMGWKDPVEVQKQLDAIEPKQDPRLGEFTPQWIRWFALNHSKQEFHAKYCRAKHRVPAELQQYFIN